MREATRSKRMELLEVVTVGLPFCGFKILVGASLVGRSEAAAPRLLGAALVCLGALDGIINGANLVGLLVRGRRPIAACTFAFATQVLRKPSSSPQKWRDLGDSLDVLLSFALVAVMIGAGQLASMPPDRLVAWNVCVILNVLGAGLGRFGESWRNLRQDE